MLSRPRACTNMPVSSLDRRNEPPDPIKQGKFTSRSQGNPAALKPNTHRIFKLQSKEKSPPSKDKSPKNNQPGPKQIQPGLRQNTANSPTPKRKDLSPAEKSTLYSNHKQPRLTHISDYSSSENVELSKEELLDIWNTMSPDKKCTKKYDYLRDMFEKNIPTTQKQSTKIDQREQVPQPRDSVSADKFSVKTTSHTYPE